MIARIRAVPSLVMPERFPFGPVCVHPCLLGGACNKRSPFRRNDAAHLSLVEKIERSEPRKPGRRVSANAAVTSTKTSARIVSIAQLPESISARTPGATELGTDSFIVLPNSQFSIDLTKSRV